MTDTIHNGGASVPASLTPENIFAGRCRIVPLRDPERLPALAAAAARDQHVAIAPTHLIERAGQIVGYASLGGAPLLNVWMDSQHCRAGDSVRMLETAEALLADKGVQLYLMACAEESPFAPHMERLGFRKLGKTVLWAKQTNG